MGSCGSPQQRLGIVGGVVEASGAVGEVREDNIEKLAGAPIHGRLPVTAYSASRPSARSP